MITRITYSILLFLFFIAHPLIGQGKIFGELRDANTQEPLEAITIFINNNNYSDFTITSIDGKFEFNNLGWGDYRLAFSHLGYNQDSISVSLDSENQSFYLEKFLSPDQKLIQEVEIVAKRREVLSQSTLSNRKIEKLEIITNPGSGSDIAKVMQILPGVATTSAFRNDLIIRGGAPSENSFYVDGIRIPVINHLVTQGASGGAVSLLNADFIENANLNSGNFSANRSNALSSVFEFDLSDGENLEPGFRFSAGATNLAIDGYGQLSDKVSYIGSVRRSYRQYILKLIGLAVYPVYNDFLLKLKMKPNPNHEITILGLGAIDQFRINNDINDSEIQAFLRESLPENDQWNYTVGVNNKIFTDNSTWSFVISRSHLYNKASRNSLISGNEETSLNYESTEISNRIETSYMYTQDRWNINIGAETTQRQSGFDVFNVSYDRDGLRNVNFQSSIDYLMYGGHMQLGASLIPGRWTINMGFRIDGSSFASQLNDPNNQFSPRISSRINITDRFSIIGGLGTYYQLPGDVTLGYAENGILVNQDQIRYIKSDQNTLGINFELPWQSQFTVEYFKKDYSNYPFNTRENISQANEGGDFGVAGNSPVSSDGFGQSRGMEIMYKQHLLKNWFGTFSYTYSESLFDNLEGEATPSSWDARHISNLVLGKRLKRNWQIGVNARYQSALPFTPFDINSSALVAAWDINQEGIRDFNLLNSARGKSTLLIDIRIDKRWNLSWADVTFYLDIENIMADADSQQVLTLDRIDSNGNVSDNPIIVNPQAPLSQQRYQLKELQNAEGVLIPTFGFIIEM